MQKFDNLLETEQNMTGFIPNCKLIYRTVKNPSLQVIWTIHTFLLPYMKAFHNSLLSSPFFPTPTHAWRLSVVRRALTASYLLNILCKKKRFVSGIDQWNLTMTSLVVVVVFTEDKNPLNIIRARNKLEFQPEFHQTFFEPC